MHDRLATRIDPPVEIELNGRPAWRFQRADVGHAIFLKNARYISGLFAGSTLISNGFFQELAVLQRTLDEIHEDIYFMAMPCFGLPKTEDHENYFSAFWEEEPDFPNYSGKQKNRHQVPRKKIRSYLSKIPDTGKPDHQSIATSGYLSRLYSGFVHAAAPQIMDMFDPLTGRFEVGGIPSATMRLDHSEDFENQFFRGTMNVFLAARILECDDVAEHAWQTHCELEAAFAGG